MFELSGGNLFVRPGLFLLHLLAGWLTFIATCWPSLHLFRLHKWEPARSIRADNFFSFFFPSPVVAGCRHGGRWQTDALMRAALRGRPDRRNRWPRQGNSCARCSLPARRVTQLMLGPSSTGCPPADASSSSLFFLRLSQCQTSALTNTSISADNGTTRRVSVSEELLDNLCSPTQELTLARVG